MFISSGLILYSLFDYFLLYDAQVLVFLYGIGLFFYQAKPSKVIVIKVFKILILGFYALNTLAATIQVLLSKNLGLKYFGEPFLNMQIMGVAKQNLDSVTLLRGYGIASHPNVLGFLGVCGLVLAFTPDLRSFWGSWSQILAFCSILIILLSFSRVSWFILGVTLAIYFWRNISKMNNSLYVGLSLSVVFSLFLALLNLMFQRVASSDQYRYSDITQYFKAIANMDYSQILFGLGLGRYPEYLFNHFNLPIWQYQPVHNVFLGLIIDVGILPIILGIFIFVLYHLVQESKSNTTINELVLYTTYFQSTNSFRQKELDYCLRNNLNNENISKIYIWCDKLPTYAQNNNKIVHIKYDAVPMFEQFIEYANKYSLGDTVVLSNSDIYFDESLVLLQTIDLNNRFLALTRIENNFEVSQEGKKDIAGNFYSYSQDVWIFKSPIRTFKSDFELGRVACENRFAAEAFFAGLEVVNPCLSIRVYHKHASAVRNWKIQEGYRGFRAFPMIADMQNITSKVQLIWE